VTYGLSIPTSLTSDDLEQVVAIILRFFELCSPVTSQ